ncbi:MAG: hypothetical protein EHM60_11110, partial [Lysobacterales bacterium]
MRPAPAQPPRSILRLSSTPGSRLDRSAIHDPLFTTPASLPPSPVPKRSKTSARWLAEHESDPYVQRAREEGWRSRAVFKLEEIQRSDHLLKPGMTVVDLGAAPGGWSQYAARVLGGRGRIVALDVLEMP